MNDSRYKTPPYDGGSVLSYINSREISHGHVLKSKHIGHDQLFALLQ